MMKQRNPHYSRPMRLPVLLHGYSGDAADWITGSPIRELDGKYNLAVVMPSGDNSFYVDAAHTGGKYASFVDRELVAYVRGLLHLPEE
ncbi:hypothetical protein [Lachnoclostridium sp. Marseille-P6806]|uniref:hypothetical protein n=1 Tax=Lachnoclostridium sp. Marseille-P6806 TaxID=2364793 RepID=UPI001030093C|nr:hypothetical protein [Lachnoclostridium sp. Marseille-P6806]